MLEFDLTFRRYLLYNLTTYLGSPCTRMPLTKSMTFLMKPNTSAI